MNIILYCNNNRLFMTLNEMTLPLNPHSFGLAVWPTFWPFSGFVFRKNQGLRAGRWRAWSPAARSWRFGGTSARLSTSSVSSSSSVLSFKLCLLTNEILNAFASSSLGRYLQVYLPKSNSELCRCFLCVISSCFCFLLTVCFELSLCLIESPPTSQKQYSDSDYWFGFF